MAKWHKQVFDVFNFIYVLAVLLYLFFVVYRLLPIEPFELNATLLSFSLLMVFVPPLGMLLTKSVYRKTAQDVIAPSRPNNLLLFVLFILFCFIAFLGHFLIFMLHVPTFARCNLPGNANNQCNDLQYCCVFPNNTLNSHCTNGPCTDPNSKHYAWELAPNERFLWNFIVYGIFVFLDIILLALSGFAGSMSNKFIDFASPSEMTDAATGVHRVESKKRK